MHKERLDHLFTGDGSVGDSYEMTGDSARSWYVKPSTHHLYVLNRMIIYIEASSFNVSDYGSTTPLSNGILVTKENLAGDTLGNFTSFPITKIYDWALFAGSRIYHADHPTDEVILINWDVKDLNVTVNGKKGQFLRFIVRDTLGGGGAGLVSHIANVHGFQVHFE